MSKTTEQPHKFSKGDFGPTTVPLCRHCGLSEQGEPHRIANEANMINDTMDLLGENRALKQQNDTLLAALREVTNSLQYVCDQEDKFRSIQLNGRAVRDAKLLQARAAIAATEGSKI